MPGKRCILCSQGITEHSNKYDLDPVTAYVQPSSDISNISGVAATPTNQLLISLTEGGVGLGDPDTH